MHNVLLSPEFSNIKKLPTFNTTPIATNCLNNYGIALPSLKKPQKKSNKRVVPDCLIGKKTKWFMIDFSMLRFIVGSLKTALFDYIENADDIRTTQDRKSVKTQEAIIQNERIDQIVNEILNNFKEYLILPQENLDKSDIYSEKILSRFVDTSPVGREINLEIFAIRLLIARFFNFQRQKNNPIHPIFLKIITKERAYELKDLLLNVLSFQDIKKDGFNLEWELAKKLANDNLK